MITLRYYTPGAQGTDPLLAGMFADRKRLFVDLLGWDVPSDGEHEIDRFDDAHARYLIAMDGKGEHIGSLRLLPTARPHLLGTLFTALCPLGVPTGLTKAARNWLGGVLDKSQRSQIMFMDRDHILNLYIAHRLELPKAAQPMAASSWSFEDDEVPF